MDDDEELVELMVDVFLRDGRFEVKSANNGFGAGMLVKEFRPDLVILDEPTAGMSPDETTSTMKLVKRLAEERGLTILFCEHDMDVVFDVAQSIMVMHHGNTIIQGEPEAIRKNDEVQEAYLGEA